MTANDQQQQPSSAEVETAEKAADEVALLVFFNQLGTDLTVGTVRDVALKVILDRDIKLIALARAQALESAARIADDWRKHDGPDISRLIRALQLQPSAASMPEEGS